VYPGFPVTPNELDQSTSLSSTKSQLLFKINDTNLYLVMYKYITSHFALIGKIHLFRIPAEMQPF